MPSRPFSPTHNPIFNSKELVITSVISASVVIIVIICFLFYYIWFCVHSRSRTRPFDCGYQLKLRKFSFKEIKSATNGFDTKNLIGKGGSGCVYLGVLRDGKSVAVKKLDVLMMSCQWEREFENELLILSGLKSPLVVSLLGYCVEKKIKVLVYEYMPNKSLQEWLFSESNSRSLNWEMRFLIIQDVVKALAFLHLECDPPVIHGDVKPSNVLLDSNYRAKISDFGLSRIKVEGEFGVEMFSQDLGRSQELTPTIATPVESGNEVDFALAIQATSMSKARASHDLRGSNMSSLNFSTSVLNKLKGKGVSSSEMGGCGDDDGPSSVEHSKELMMGVNSCPKQWGKDWWWRQDGSGELCSKDYVTEWIGSQICPSSNPDWDEEKKNSPEQIETHAVNSNRVEKFDESSETHLPKLGFENAKVGVDEKKHRKMQEWWKDEHIEVRKKNGGRIKKLKGLKCVHLGVFQRLRIRKQKRTFEDKKKIEYYRNGELSFRRGWKKKNSRSGGSEMWSGDLFSRELSSTTSMRGTLCYVAPECGGYGYLMEKADIYSLGVLILVIVSGRRPLHVLSSPMKLEKANLISWCKQLAQAGNVLELVDERLKDAFDKSEASLCINLALTCLQKTPELRPDIGEIVKILKGEMCLPPLPFEFSPSPHSKAFGRSRRKQKSNVE